VILTGSLVAVESSLGGQIFRPLYLPARDLQIPDLLEFVRGPADLLRRPAFALPILIEQPEAPASVTGDR